MFSAPPPLCLGISIGKGCKRKRWWGSIFYVCFGFVFTKYVPVYSRSNIESRKTDSVRAHKFIPHGTGKEGHPLICNSFPCPVLWKTNQQRCRLELNARKRIKLPFWILPFFWSSFITKVVSHLDLELRILVILPQCVCTSQGCPKGMDLRQSPQNYPSTWRGQKYYVTLSACGHIILEDQP